MHNIILMTDSYKFSHYKQYPPKTEQIYSYFESRNGAKFDNTVFFGLQYYIQKYLSKPISINDINYAEKRINAHLGADIFNRAGWEHILNKHNGYLPVKIKAVPEGTLVPTSNVLMTIENTDPACWWLTNYLETLLVEVWYPSTVATQSYEMRRIIQKYLDTTGSDAVDFKLHDFGFRGVSCPEQAGLGGAAHLLNFKGTDTFAGIELLNEYYGEEMAGFSIPASEHSTITAWGREHENDAMRNMLEQYPNGTIACVSDSYNLWDACEKIWGTELRDKILSREGCLVIRPDSGTPEIILPQVMQILADQFGSTVNEKGYKVLNPKVRVIQGDGIDIESMAVILARLESIGWSADNIAFGSGGGLLQKVNRDTQRFAFKCSSATVNGKERGVYKDPITDISKVSKLGKQCLVKEGNKYLTMHGVSSDDILQTVYENGHTTQDTFDNIRNRLYHKQHNVFLQAVG